jgi:hypothetical protein
VTVCRTSRSAAGRRSSACPCRPDPALGDPLAASYNDIDPYKGTAFTNASPNAVNNGISGSGFHASTAISGDFDFVDT